MSLPPGLTAIPAVQALIYNVPYQMALAGISVPLVLFLILNSTRRIRRSASFWLCILSFCLSSIQAGLVVKLFNDIALDPITGPSASLSYAVAFVGVSTPFYADLVMPIRLAAFYPRWRSNLRQVLPVFAFPILMKVVRFGNLIAYYVVQHRRFFDEGVTVSNSANKGQPIPQTIEYALQLIDNGYIAAFFIYKLRGFQQQSAARSHRPTTLVERISMIIGVAVASYAIPVLFNLVMLITGSMTSDPTAISVYNYIVGPNATVTTWNIIITTALLTRPGEKVLGATMLQSIQTQTFAGEGSGSGQRAPQAMHSTTSLPTLAADRKPSEAIRMDIVRTEEAWGDDTSSKA